MPLDDYLARKDWIGPRQDRWSDILPESWQTAINTSPTLNALARYMSRPSFEEGVKQWQDSIPGNSPIDRIADRKSTLAQEFPSPMNPLGQSLMETGGFLANFIGPGAKLPPASAPKPQGIRAYHGSPYDFDKFDISKIGTGEGAQAYGRGLYFAENEGVAKSYRDNVKDMGRVDAINQRLTELAREMTKLEKPGQYRQYREPRGYELADEYDRLMNEKLSPPPGRMYEVRINADPETFLDWDKPLSQQPEAVRRAVEKLPQADVLTRQNGASSVTPLMEREGDAFYNALAEALGRPYDPKFPRRAEVLDHAKASQALRDAGIPVIKYKDQMSRNATPQPLLDGQPIKGNQAADTAAVMLRRNGGDVQKAVQELEKSAAAFRNDPTMLEAASLLRDKRVTLGEPPGTNNYVVLDDKIIEILRKYGLLPPVAAGAAQALSQGQDTAY